MTSVDAGNCPEKMDVVANVVQRAKSHVEQQCLAAA